MGRKEIVIIGAVAAGMSAASKARRLSKDANITVFEKGEHISYGACGLPYFISDVIQDEQKMMIRTVEDFAKEDITIHLYHEVTRVIPEDKNILVKDLKNNQYRIVPYDELLIATGASPIIPPIQGIHYPNVFTLKTISDGQRMKRYLADSQIREVSIVGAGYIGMELVESMLEMGKQVRLIEYQSQILPQFDAELVQELQDDLVKKGVRIHLGEKVENIRGETIARSVITNLGEYEAHAVILSIGVRPNTDFLQNTKIQRLKNGAIIVDEYQRTNTPHIYAAGDCATSHHLVLQQPMHIALGTVANKQGRVAGENIAGGEKRFPGVLGTSVAKVNQFTVAKTGISEKEAKTYQIPYKTVTVKAGSHASYYPNAKPITIKLVYRPESKELLGAQMVGEDGVAKRIDIFATAIHQKMTTEEIGYLDLSYAPPYASVWDAVQIAANAAK